MSLRIRRPSSGNNEEALMPAGEPSDDWGTRLVKLIPSEALGLYSAAVGMIKQTDPKREGFNANTALIIAMLASIILLILIRYRATQDPATGKPQFRAVGIALVSFFVWLAALAATGEGLSPLSGMPGVVYAPLIALIWVIFVPFIYKGD